MRSEPADIMASIQELYMSDSIPWIVGYSGGKDSTATLQLIWKAIAELPTEQRTKPVHVISTDTLVENPVIAKWVEASLATMQANAIAQSMPIYPNRLTPSIQDRFWVNLIGKGYPAPRPKFRWCTDRLKINPSNKFIQELSEANGEAILVLGQRRGESAVRDDVMNKYQGSTRARLSRNGNPRLSRVWVFLPIEDWTSDDVWEYLVTEQNPWGIDNQQLFQIYRGATPDAECPIVVDTSTPSCGDSRFGCFVCTMVAQDKSMQAMIQNDNQKQWMKPMLDFRNNYLAVDDRELRDFRRMDGSLLFFNERLVHGPYLQEYRAQLLRELLKTQKQVSDAEEIQSLNVDLITIEELDEIRRIWVEDKGEIEDLVPIIYEEVFGTEYPGIQRESPTLSTSDLQLLREVCSELELGAGDGSERYKMARNLLASFFQAEQTHKRSKLLDQLEKVVKAHAFVNEEDAENFARNRSVQVLPAQTTEPYSLDGNIII